MPSRSLAPQQQRSRETLARLLQATVETLEKHGLDGATIPVISAAAGVAPATVYRRFLDRDALLRAAFMHVLQQSAAANAAVSLASFKKPTLEGVVGELVAAGIAQFKTYPGLFRAFARFVESDSDEDFRARALAILSGNYKNFVDLLLNFRAQIAHPNPKRAIVFALLSAVTAIEERALEKMSMWHELLPISDRELQKELTRSFVSYLRSR